MHTLESISSIIEDKLNVDLKSSKRPANIVLARSMFYYFCRKLVPNTTYKSLADFVGRFQHGTVTYALDKFDYDIKYNNEYKKAYELLCPYILNKSEHDYVQLESMVLNWAKEKGILDKATTTGQALKTLEECNELIDAIDKENKAEIIDALGDILVTIIIQSEMQDVCLIDCLNSAYNVIAKRTGKMVDGQFVKDK